MHAHARDATVMRQRDALGVARPLVWFPLTKILDSWFGFLRVLLPFQATLTDVQGIFIFLGACLLFSTVALVCEIIIAILVKTIRKFLQAKKTTTREEKERQQSKGGYVHMGNTVYSMRDRIWRRMSVISRAAEE